MIGMDTGSGKGGRLAGLRLDDMTEFYSNQNKRFSFSKQKVDKTWGSTVKNNVN